MNPESRPPVELDARDWQIVQAILARLLPNQEVWAFGSRARGGAKKYSDLDLAVVGEERQPFSLLNELAEAFDESDLTIKVDLVDWAATREAFRRIIEKDRVVVQAKAEVTSSAFA